MNLGGMKLALWGADLREVVLAEKLLQMGAEVQAWALPEQEGLTLWAEPESTLQGVHALILPAQNLNRELVSQFSRQPLALKPELFQSLPPGTLVLAGKIGQELKQILRDLQLKPLEIFNSDFAAILNSVPSAEGAVCLAMQETDITIHNSRILICGLGRIGLTLARILRNMDAQVTIAGNDLSQKARAWSMGLEWVDFAHWDLSGFDIIFNTVPALILDARALEKCSGVIIDLASEPGGTDFAKARQLGLKAVLAPGLPGKYAPKTAGQILAQIVPELLISNLPDYSGGGF